MLRSHFHEYKKNFESVVFTEEERVPAQEDPETEGVCRFDCNHEYTLRYSETEWKHGGFEVIGKFNVYS